MFRYEGLLVLSSRSPELLVRHGSSPRCVKHSSRCCAIWRHWAHSTGPEGHSLDVSMCSVPSACCVCSVCSVHKSGVLEHNREVNA